MNIHRTFGVEIECFSMISRADLAMEIQRAFTDAGIGHHVNATLWMQNRDSENTTHWTVKTDSSLRHLSLPGTLFPMEIVTPVLKGEDGLKAIKVACSVIERHCRVNKSCGLHVHHGVKRNELASIGEAWIRAETFIMEAMPRSRRNNRYCREWNQFVNPGTGNVTSHPAIRTEKYRSLNISSFIIRGTVEFRCHSGTVDCEKITNWVLVTQGLIEAACRNENVDLNSIQDVARLIGSNGSDSQDLTDIRGQFKRNSIRAKMIEFLAESPRSWHELTQMVGRPPYKAIKVFKEKGLVSKDNEGRFHLNTEEAECNSMYSQAADWLVSRYNQFRTA